ncbi:hypothetical protein BDR04DRAFT_1162647 [Suillus decipiens]|nr:hypothetical protein BDR04DRAFT_1162647 [Suillus decipiens]
MDNKGETDIAHLSSIPILKTSVGTAPLWCSSQVVVKPVVIPAWLPRHHHGHPPGTPLTAWVGAQLMLGESSGLPTPGGPQPVLGMPSGMLPMGPQPPLLDGQPCKPPRSPCLAGKQVVPPAELGQLETSAEFITWMHNHFILHGLGEQKKGGRETTPQYQKPTRIWKRRTVLSHWHSYWT